MVLIDSRAQVTSDA